MRCICCNTILSSSDLFLTKPDGSLEDFCVVCRNIAQNPDNLVTKEYAHAPLTEGMSYFTTYRE